MKKILKLPNLALLIVLVLVTVVTLKTTEVKATGTVTWPNGSTATITRTVENVYNAPEVEFTYQGEIPKTEATFARSRDVNGKMKNVANNTTSMSQASADTAIMAIKRATSLPNDFTPTTMNTVSLSGSRPIYIFFDGSTGTLYYYSDADILYLEYDSSRMFYAMQSLSDISGLSYIDTSKSTTFEYMFYQCPITNINALASWDTSHVSNMNYMFQNCSSLENINGASNWNTSSVTQMGGMFRYCSKASGTIQILGNPTSYGNAFTSAATQSGAQITVNYGSGTSNIDSIIATKSGSSNVVKGSVVSVPSGSGSSSGLGFETTITFNGSETVSNSYTATKSTTIDLSNIGLDMSGPGVYNLTVKETATNNNAYPTTNTEYTVTIQVQNVLDNNNMPTGNFTATYVIKDANDNKVNTMNFSHPKDESKFGHIELTKTVKGTMADPTKYFDFSVQVDNTNGGTCSSYTGSEKYPVSGVDSGRFSSSEVTKCKSGTKDSLSLKRGQTAKIGQFTYNNTDYDSISIDDYYKIVEANESGYTTTFKVNSGSVTSGGDTGSKSITHAGNVVTFYNQKEGSPVTGIITTILPFLILIGIGTGGFVLFRKKNKNKEELEVI